MTFKLFSLYYGRDLLSSIWPVAYIRSNMDRLFIHRSFLRKSTIIDARSINLKIIGIECRWSWQNMKACWGSGRGEELTSNFAPQKLSYVMCSVLTPSWPANWSVQGWCHGGCWISSPSRIDAVRQSGAGTVVMTIEAVVQI